MKEKRSIPIGEIEEAAAKIGNAKKICEKFGVNSAYIYQKNRIDKDFREAYERGIKQFNDKKSEKTVKATAEKAKPAAEIEEIEPALSKEEVKTRILFAVDNHFCLVSQIKKYCHFDFDISPFLDALVFEDKLRIYEGNSSFEAYVRFDWGIEKLWLENGKVGIHFINNKRDETAPPIYNKPKKSNGLEMNPRFENTLQHLDQNGHSKGLIGRAKEELTENPARLKPHLEKIELGEGELLIGLNSNIFKLNPQQREKLNRIIDLVQEF